MTTNIAGMNFLILNW